MVVNFNKNVRRISYRHMIGLAEGVNNELEKHKPFDINIEPFYSEINMSHLRRGIAALNAAKGEEHEPVEEEKTKES